jgi:hypothetical protein
MLGPLKNRRMKALPIFSHCLLVFPSLGHRSMESLSEPTFTFEHSFAFNFSALTLTLRADMAAGVTARAQIHDVYV